MGSEPSAWAPERFEHARFARLADLVHRIAGEHDWPSIDTLNHAFVRELQTVGVRLVEAAKTKPALGADGTLDPSTLYEIRIVEYGEIPTRPRNAHDLLNALVWAAFPRSKLEVSRALAALQRERAKGRTQLPSTRTKDHDRLAMIDEGAVLRVGGASTHSVWIFGHAILEHAYAGVFDVRGAAVDLDVPGVDLLAPIEARAAVDRVFAGSDLPRVVRAGAGVPVDE